MAPKTNQDIKYQVKEAIKELLADGDFINKILTKVTDKINAVEKAVQKQESKIERLEQKIENILQNRKDKNICIYGLDEEEHEKLSGKILTLCNEKIKVPIKNEDIIKCYRLGNNKGPKGRPLIVKFEKLYHKYEVLKSRKNLKGTKIVVCEDLTKSRLSLFLAAQEMFGKKFVYTYEGNVFVKFEDGTRKKILNQAELHDL